MLKKAHPLGTSWFIGPDWTCLLRSYQEAPSPTTSSALVTALANGIGWCLEALEPAAPVVDVADLRQELLLQVLEAATDLPLDTAAEWIPVRLLEQARRRVFRWLRRQNSPITEPLDPLMPSDNLVEELASSVPPIAHGGHLYGKVVEGTGYADQARALRLAAATVRKRASRERIRLRRRHASLSR